MGKRNCKELAKRVFVSLTLNRFALSEAYLLTNTHIKIEKLFGIDGEGSICNIYLNNTNTEQK